MKRFFANAFPLLAVLVAIFLLGYPIAFLAGYPLAKTNLEDRNRWSQKTIEAAAPLDISDPGVMQFGNAVDLDRGLLIWGRVPVAQAYALESGWVKLQNGASQAPVLVTPEGAVDGQNQVFRAAELSEDKPLYLDKKLLTPGYEKPAEKADGQRLNFTFASSAGVFILRGQLLQAEQDYTINEGIFELTQPAPLWLSLRSEPDWARPLRITGDYAWADDHTVVLLNLPALGSEIAIAEISLRWAERLSGAVDGTNRTFNLAHDKLVPGDEQRRVFVDQQLLRVQERRAREATDGKRVEFTFPEPGGLITLDGRLLRLGEEYRQAGELVIFNEAPPRLSQPTQHDYVVVDADRSTILLGQAPPPNSLIWTDRYTIHDQPKCGSDVFECFLTLPQHPVPLPHWIFTKAPSFLTRFAWESDRNVLREVFYTARGTFVALATGGVVGLLLAALFVLIRPLERALLPWVITSQTVPIIALVPMLVLVLANFGIRIQTSILPTAIIGGYLSFFPITIGAAKGLRSVDPLSLDLMRSYAASKGQVFYKVRLYAALPFIFASFKVGAAASLVGTLISETETSNAKGLGFAILGQVQAGNVADLWILFFISSLLGIFFVSAVGWAERFIAPWMRKV